MASPNPKRSKPVVVKSLKAYSFTPARELKQYHFPPEVYNFWSKHVEGKFSANAGAVLMFDVVEDLGLFDNNSDQEAIERFSDEVVRMANVLGYHAEALPGLGGYESDTRHIKICMV